MHWYPLTYFPNNGGKDILTSVPGDVEVEGSLIFSEEGK